MWRIEFGIASLQHNFSHQQTSSKGRTLTHYSLEEFFYPSLAVSIVPASGLAPSNNSFYVWAAFAVIICAMSTAMAFHVISTNQAIRAELVEFLQRLGQHFDATVAIRDVQGR